jgi:replicative DNA helicase
MSVEARPRGRRDHINPPYDPWAADKDYQRAVNGNGHHGEAAPWPDPEPLGQVGVGKPDLFPTDVVPAVFGDMITAVAGNKQVPVDLPALMGLAAAAALAAPRLAIECEPGWTEPLNIYAACALEPGSLKSPATTDVTEEIRRLQKVLRANHADQVENERRDLNRVLASARERKAAAKTDEDKAGLAALIRETEDKIKALDETVTPRILMPADTTVENLTKSMSTNGEHGAILDSEGTFFTILLGRYTGGVPNLDSVLKAYDGDYIEVGRINRQQRDMTRAVLTLGLAVQPMILEDAGKSRAVVEQGLLGRFLLAIPESLIGYRKPRGTPYDPQALAAWAACLRRIGSIDVADPETPRRDFPRLFLTDAARDVFFEYKQRLEVALRPDGELGDLRGWGAKHAGRTLRIAGLLHLIAGEPADVPVGLDTMRSAIQVAEWAVPHAVVVFGMEDESPRAEDEQAVALLHWIQEKRPEVLSLNEINRKCRQAWVKKGKKAAIVPVVDRLLETGWLRERATQDKAGRPAVVYDRHPRLESGGPLW